MSPKSERVFLFVLTLADHKPVGDLRFCVE